VVKNKVAPPFKQAEFDIMFDEGISAAGSVLDAAIECGVIEKNGNWFSYNGDKIGQGREATKAYLKNNPNRLKEVENKVREIKKGVD
jgi:recombination protein RecA